jgi:hypothetical protein
MEGGCNGGCDSLTSMNENERSAPSGPPHDWPDEEGSSEEAQKSLRSDVGASLERPREEDAPDPDRVEPSGQRGPAGAGQVPGRGKLGAHTPTEKGAEQGPR